PCGSSVRTDYVGPRVRAREMIRQRSWAGLWVAATHVIVAGLMVAAIPTPQGPATAVGGGAAVEAQRPARRWRAAGYTDNTVACLARRAAVVAVRGACVGLASSRREHDIPAPPELVGGSEHVPSGDGRVDESEASRGGVGIADPETRRGHVFRDRHRERHYGS